MTAARPPTIILRHRRENLKKCSLSGLEGQAGLQFLIYPKDPLPELSAYVLLELGADPLTEKDRDRGIFLIDATWRLAERIKKQCPPMQTRSLPASFCTAYPRRQTDCQDPEKGLASIEALYLAHLILGRDVAGLLDGYHWKNEFLRLNNLDR
jgi:pre-rRNA-processing protein TSR3